MQLSGLYPNMTDSELDANFAASYYASKQVTGAAKQAYVTSYIDLGTEILDRLQSFWSFAGGLVGSTRFPKFSAIQATEPGGFLQSTEARSTTAASASNVASSAKSALAIGVGSVALYGLAAVALYAYISRRK